MKQKTPDQLDQKILDQIGIRMIRIRLICIVFSPLFNNLVVIERILIVLNAFFLSSYEKPIN